MRVVGGELWLELSEAVSGEAIGDAIADSELTLTETGSGTSIELTATQPIEEGRQAGQRLVLTPASTPAAGTEVELVVPAGALVDEFLNSPSSDATLVFPWPSGDAVVDDTVAPRVEQVIVRDRRLEVELSEEPNLAAAAAAIDVPGQTLTWSLSSDRYTLVSNEILPVGTHALEISTFALDLAGLGLDETFSTSLAVGAEDSIAYEAEDPDETTGSAIGNSHGFHGRDHDPATGLIYFRNRWLDPELGRFITDDPFLYADAPNAGQFALHSPYVLSDPFGTRVHGSADARRHRVTVGEAIRNIGIAGYAFYDQVDETGGDLGVNSGDGDFSFLAGMGDRAVFSLHGYNVDRSQGMAALANVDHGFKYLGGAEQQLYGFLWKGDPLGSPWSAPAFWWAEGNADTSAVAFADFVRDARQSAGWSMDMMAMTHSLGARVALRSLQILSAWNRGLDLHADGQYMLDGTFMMNAAVTHTSLRQGGWLEEAFGESRVIRSYYSGGDPVLRRAFRIAKFGRKALGGRSVEANVQNQVRGGLLAFDEFDMMDPNIAGTPVTTHSAHLRPLDHGGAEFPWKDLWQHLRLRMDKAARVSKP